jgi:WD40 repeat protein
MESHSDGEVWGLTRIDNKTVATSCDDNKVKIWNLESRKCIATGKISDSQKNAKKGGAGTLSQLPASQCSRALAYNSGNDHLAVAHNDGTVTIRTSKDPNTVKFTMQDSSEWIEVM